MENHCPHAQGRKDWNAGVQPSRRARLLPAAPVHVGDPISIYCFPFLFGKLSICLKLGFCLVRQEIR